MPRAWITIRVLGWKCRLCGHKWVQRRPRSRHFAGIAKKKLPPPYLCAKCKSPRWNELP